MTDSPNLVYPVDGRYVSMETLELRKAEAKIAELRVKLNAALIDVGQAILNERELCARVADQLAERDPAQAQHYHRVASLIRTRD